MVQLTARVGLQMSAPSSQFLFLINSAAQGTGSWKWDTLDEEPASISRHRRVSRRPLDVLDPARMLLRCAVRGLSVLAPDHAHLHIRTLKKMVRFRHLAPVPYPKRNALRYIITRRGSIRPDIMEMVQWATTHRGDERGPGPLLNETKELRQAVEPTPR